MAERFFQPMEESYTQQNLAEMLEWATTHSNEWRLEGRDDKRGLHLRILLARSTETFAAATALIGRRFPHHAIMLARSLFEDMVLACWIKWVADPDFVSARLADQHRHGQLIMVELADKYHTLPRIPPQPEVTQEECERYQTLFGRYGQRTWWAVPGPLEERPNPKPEENRYRASKKLRSTADLLTEVEHRAASRLVVVGSDPRPPRELMRPLRYLFDVVNRINNLTLHHTSHGHITPHADVDSDERNEEWAFVVLMARSTLVMTYDKLVFVMLRHGNAHLEKSYRELRSRF
jgi:hypothetical protein